MAPGNASTFALLDTYLEQFPEVHLLEPNTTTYEDAREAFVIRPARPFAIARPRSATGVQALVRFCAEHDIDLNVRSGGHDGNGRSQVDGALLIDMRNIAYVNVDDDRQTARVGGGVLLGDLTKRLGDEHLVTPCGSVASVGYTGWSSLGGYGAFSSLYSLGVDQIVGAKLVSAQGRLIDADDELLVGIRGAGGAFGIIVELTVKVHPFDNSVLTSSLIYNSTDMQGAWNTFTAGWDDLLATHDVPKSLTLQQFALDIPDFGKVLSVGATWVDGDMIEGRKWIYKIAALGDCINSTVQQMTLEEFTKHNEATVSWPAYGRSHSISIKSFTLKSLAVLAQFSESIPGGGAGLALHELRDPPTSNISVWGTRESHHMIEILSTTTDPDYVEAADTWATSFINELNAKDPDNVLPGYISLMSNEAANLSAIYGDGLETVLSLKDEYDPTDVFKFTIPRLDYSI